MIEFDAKESGSVGKEEGEASAGMPGKMEAVDRRAMRRGFLIVSLIAALFLGYGIFMYFAIGDRGDPDWDFGGVEETPAQSIYSTAPPAAPQPQHVDRMPSGAGPPKGLGRR